MKVESFEGNFDTVDAVAVLQRDGAVILRNLVESQVVDRVLSELRAPLDLEGHETQSGFNGYETLRLHQILARSRSSVELAGHPRVLEFADAVLLPHAVNYRLASLSAIEIHPGETPQSLHADDEVFPLRIPGLEMMMSTMWAITDFTEENGATRVMPRSHDRKGQRSHSGSET